MAKKDQVQESKSKFEEKLKSLESRYGSGTVIMGKDVQEKLEVVPTGSFMMDIASSIGGWPVGKLIEIMGMESSGKSTIALHAIREFQRLEGRCALIDYEQSFDRSYAEALGVNMEKLVIVQPSCQEDGYNITEELIRTGEVRLIVKDSHTAAMPRKVVEGEVGDQSIGLQARNNSAGLGKIKPLLMENRCTVIGISQIRQNIGGYGDVNQSTGGLSWKFYADIRVKFNKSVDKEKESNKTTAEFIKNKCGTPYGKAEFRINWGMGIDRMQEIIDLAVEFKIIAKGGAGWYTLGENTKLQGDEKLKEFFADNPEWAADIEQKVTNKVSGIDESVEIVKEKDDK